MKTKIAVISCSLNTASRSKILAHMVVENLSSLGAEVDSIDLQDYQLPFCDGGPAYNRPEVKNISAQIANVEAVLMAVPIYNYSANAGAKNLIELTGSVWENKIVGFLAAAGGHSSYMAVMSLANQLMLDFRCLVVPRFVYATGSDFGPGTDGKQSLLSAKIAERVEELAETTLNLAKRLRITDE